jgi:YgiT-type zinc finger domain-containing protein
MASQEEMSARALCPRCNRPLVETRVKTAIWQGDRMAVVEDIPALVCGTCGEQFYDEDVSDALRQLNEDGFPLKEASRTIEVPVFTLDGRIRTRVPLPEDTYVD